MKMSPAVSVRAHYAVEPQGCEVYCRAVVPSRCTRLSESDSLAVRYTLVHSHVTDSTGTDYLVDRGSTSSPREEEQEVEVVEQPVMEEQENEEGYVTNMPEHNLVDFDDFNPVIDDEEHEGDRELRAHDEEEESE